MSSNAAIDVKLGPCDDMRAEVFVRPRGDHAAGGRLVGVITGPSRGRDATLPTTTRLVPLPAAASAGPLSRAILTEPAFWTPELPNLYRVEARLEADPAGFVVDAWIGLRRLGVRGRSFWLDGRRWVPRAVAGGDSVAATRAAAVGLVVESPADELLDTADSKGVAVVVVLRRGEATPARVAALAGHPSVVLAILPDDVAPATVAALRSAKGTLQIGLAVEGGEPPTEPPDGIDFTVVRLAADGLPHAAWRRPPSRPLVAWRPAAVADRAACDAMQRDLALWGLDAGPQPGWDWAGYLVGAGWSGGTLGS